MATHRYDPYLWVHLAGLATVPLWLAISMLGLAVGSPQWPGLELALLALLGVSPALWMQLRRPFYIFSLLALTLKPTALSDDQRRMLTLFQQWWVRSLAIVSPVLLVWLLWEIYPRAVVASDITPFASLGHFGGLAVAAGSFALANLFLQVPVSVLAVMATSEKRFKRTTPYPLDRVKANFTQVGIPLNRLLPEVLPPNSAVPAVEDIVDKELVLQKPEAVDLEAAVGTELVDVGLTDSGLAEAELADSELSTLETTTSLGLDATAVEPKMNEAQVWAEALQPLTESSETEFSEVLALEDDGLDTPPPTQGEHESWNNEEMDEPLPASVEIEDGVVADLENAEIESGEQEEVKSEEQETVDATAHTPTEFATVDEVLPESLEPVMEEIAESSITSLNDVMDRCDDSDASSDDTEINEITNEITTVEATVEAADIEVDDIETSGITVEATVEEIDLETNDTTVEAAAEAMVEAVEVVAEVSASESQTESQSSEGWDHGNDGWDQTTRDWEQDPDWDASADAAKERTVEVAVVRISDPS